MNDYKYSTVHFEDKMQTSQNLGAVISRCVKNGNL